MGHASSKPRSPSAGPEPGKTPETGPASGAAPLLLELAAIDSRRLLGESLPDPKTLLALSPQELGDIPSAGVKPASCAKWDGSEAAGASSIDELELDEDGTGISAAVRFWPRLSSSSMWK